MQFPEEFECLSGHADMVIGRVGVHGKFAAFHPVPRDDPFSYFEIDFTPGCFNEFTGSEEQQKDKPQGDTGRHV